MALTNEEAQALIDIPKKIMVDEQPQDEYIMRFSGRIQSRFELVSDDGTQIFLLELRQGEHNFFKITLHFQENSKYIGLLRIDYNGSHKNPKISMPEVPAFVLPFADAFIRESHVHLYVQGYKPLTWAVPLPIYDFDVKSISNMDSFVQAVREFCRRINITTHCNFDGGLLL
ncbi:MAG: hypothetical protein IJT82_07390 [Schwartzia sp.]|nr:hypothetical protein [Schwartzia sp. (in: firmicutes)]